MMMAGYVFLAMDHSLGILAPAMVYYHYPMDEYEEHVDISMDINVNGVNVVLIIEARQNLMVLFVRCYLMQKLTSYSNVNTAIIIIIIEERES
jgi:hypothetical protein